MHILILFADADRQARVRHHAARGRGQAGADLQRVRQPHRRRLHVENQKRERDHRGERRDQGSRQHSHPRVEERKFPHLPLLRQQLGWNVHPLRKRHHRSV